MGKLAVLTWPRWKGNHRIQQAAVNAPALSMRIGENPQNAEAVSLLQEALGVLAITYPASYYPCGLRKSTGVYDQETHNAVVHFQKVNGLDADGKAGNQTILSMDEQMPVTMPWEQDEPTPSDSPWNRELPDLGRYVRPGLFQ